MTNDSARRAGHRRSAGAPFATARAAIEAVRTGNTSASELVQLTFDRLDRHDPILNAIVWQDRERAIERARHADEVLARGASLGPLHGLPVTIKDAFAYQGSPSAWGMPHLGGLISDRTAVAVERLEAAGAIVVGKTNVPVMLGDWQTVNPIHGATNNPWDVRLTAGGSTGGGAAALAAGLGFLSLGSDLSGSIRIPAHFCGVYGHKPSLGLVSLAGFQPGPWDGSPGYDADLAVAGPMARDAADLALALNVLGGPAGDEDRAWTWRVPAPRHTRLRSYRVGFVLDDPIAPVASDVRRVYENLITRLAATGATVEGGWPRGIDPRAQLTTFQYLLFAFLSVGSGPAEHAGARRRLARNPHDVSAGAMVDPHAVWLEESRRRRLFRAAWQHYFRDVDVFLAPVAFTTAFPHDHSSPIERRRVETIDGTRAYLDLPVWSAFATVAGLPSTAAPVGRTSAGLPVGIQIIAPMWEDGTSIEFASLLSDLVGGFTPPPEFAG